MKAVCIVIALLISFAAQSQTSFIVHFDFNKSDLTEAGRSQLDSFLLAQKTGLPGLIISLDGHCDAIGSDEYNNKLSQKRVAAVKNYFLENGIQSARIGNEMGYGERRPLNENKTEEERQLNRRVEISFTVSEPSNPPGVVSLKEKMADPATKAGTNIILQNINFVGGRHEFRPESYPVLQELLETMKIYPHLVIDIQGHICCTPTTDDGLDTQTGLYNLSQARAKAVRDYLLENGIDSNRVTYKGIGHFNPIYPYPETSETEQILNRRVEIKIISK